MMKRYQYVYFIGIGGIGMSALARWFKAQSVHVFGYDRTTSPLTDQLLQEGMHIQFEDHIKVIPKKITRHKDQTLIVYTPAISSQNRVLRYFQANRYTVYKRAEVLGMITQGHRTLAVAGTHGKTTTASLAAHVLHNAGKDMVAFLGGIVKSYASNLLINGQVNKDTVMVVEADEFDQSFLQLKPDIAITTTVDPDHLDSYGSTSNFQAAFKAFMKRVPSTGTNIMHQNVAQQLHIDTQQPHSICYALAGTTIHAAHVHTYQGDFYFDYVSPEVTIRNIRLVIPGYHNVANAMAVITACLILGLDPETIHQGIASFPGIQRRFDYIIRNEQLTCLDDYAHHPVEITALLKTVRVLYPNQKITAVFRPHLYTRTRDWSSAFAQSLDLADQVFLLDIYPEREQPIEGVTSKCIFDQMKLDHKWMCVPENLLAALTQHSTPQVLVLMGAGDVHRFATMLKHAYGM